MSGKNKRPKNREADGTSRPAGGRNDYALGVCIFLVLATLLVFWRTIGFDFLPYDDNVYVYENLHVTRGLSWANIRWAFTPSNSTLGLWTPLTTLSHMATCQVFGINAWGHHLVNVLLHVANAVLLFLVLRSMSGALWRSAFVALVFAIHPLRVESVAWVAERKDVLSGFFFMLTLAAYAWYVRKRTLTRYLAVLLALIAGLLSKQMLVTVPFLLLLLDYWPLGRLQTGPRFLGDFARLTLEKIPLMIFAVAAVMENYFDNAPDLGGLPVIHGSWVRVGNAFVCYVTYIGQLFYPVKLVPLYPFPVELLVWQVAGAFLLLVGISAVAFVLRRKAPWFGIGWCWYLGMMFPAIGILPIGKEGHADRYTYLPMIGICIVIAWAVERLSASWSDRREILAIGVALVVALLLRLSAAQCVYWHDGETLWRRTLECIPDNPIANNYLGYAILSPGREDEAIAEFEKSRRGMPHWAEPENNLGMAIFQKGDVDGAIPHFVEALKKDPSHIEARSNLALALIQKRQLDDAERELRIVIAMKPNRADAYGNFGNVLLQKGDVEGAIGAFTRALKLNPDYIDGLANLGNAYVRQGNPAGAILQYQKALHLNPQNPTVQINMARVLATAQDASVRDGNKAVTLALQANELTGGKNPAVLDTLAASYAEAGRFSEAIETSLRALDLVEMPRDAELAANLRAHLALYRENTPLRQSEKKAQPIGSGEHQP